MHVVRRSARSGAAARLAVLAGAFLPGLAFAEYGLNFPAPVTPIAQKIFDLHMLILWICVAIFVVVFGFMFYSIAKHRKSLGARPATFHDNVKLEVFWTIIPFLILVGMAIPSTATLIEMEDTSRSDMTVKITGYQWKWKYDYPDHDVSFFSNLSTPRDQIENRADKGDHYLIEVDNPVVLPVKKKVRFLLTANDVIHAWWVPQLGVKKDAIPGFINEMWTYIEEPGVYRGQCAELCGKDHGFMPIVVNAVSQEEFDKWVASQKQRAAGEAAAADKVWSKNELLAKGKQVYQQCAACHGPNGEGVGPFPKMTGSKIATGPIAEHLNIVLNGKPGTAMQAFGPQLSDADIAAVVTYERNALGNQVGDIVQPAQVAAARKGGAVAQAK
ncbi:cytochrome c oxidase subunit II [Sulfurifustis variabilis]|uniref:Cytochrome c oxidase subunit 2 n=1 Tax=Sulfurifustis variabilis TaxID=1675686 RepID=A0A1B4V0Q2_9GAMM|nr:cytochrome c oxidase subunit II [Sulfurifustis variabilis]BAU47036.1 cytochrome c oxidase subunit II [Sulfurifustis variabilis]